MSILARIKRLSSLWMLQIIFGWISGWLYLLLIVPIVTSFLLEGFFAIGIIGILFCLVNVYVAYETLIFSREIDKMLLQFGAITMFVSLILGLISFSVGPDAAIMILALGWLLAVASSIMYAVSFVALSRDIKNAYLLIGGILYLIFPPIGGLVVGISLNSLGKEVDRILTSEKFEEIKIFIMEKIFNRDRQISIEDITKRYDIPITLTLIVTRELLSQVSLGRVKERTIVIDEELQNALVKLENRLSPVIY